METKFKNEWTVFAEGFLARIYQVLDAGGHHGCAVGFIL